MSLWLKELHKFKTIVSIYFGANSSWSKTWNDASIWVGSDKTSLSTALTECLFKLNDNFLKTLPSHCQQIASDVITFRRDSLAIGLGGGLRFGLVMTELRVY